MKIKLEKIRFSPFENKKKNPILFKNIFFMQKKFIETSLSGAKMKLKVEKVNEMKIIGLEKEF